MKFYIYTLGCKVNAYESELMKEMLLQANYIWDEENPDIVIINTCSVTNIADQKSRKEVRHYRKLFPHAILVVAGCSTQNNESSYENLGIDILLGNQKKSEILNLILDYQKTKKPYTYINKERLLPFEDMQLKKFTTHTRAYVKIEDGCDNFCSYCVIPFTRGSIRSKDLDKVICEVKNLTDNNHQEIVLTGIHTGAYKDRENHDLTDLIREISKFPKLKRIRISSIEITELNDKFLEELKNNPKICNHLHIPLQAGSDEILKIMNRKYNLEYFTKKIEEIRKIRPDIAITTDVIVGHPYETEELFLKTLDTVKKLQFSKVHVFPYSRRDKTPASKMPNQVVKEEKARRSKALVKLSNELESNYLEKFVGEVLEVLTEHKKDYVIGLTSNYLKVKMPPDTPLNKLIKVKVLKKENDILIVKSL